jgi:hypothetical protein
MTHFSISSVSTAATRHATSSAFDFLRSFTMSKRTSLSTSARVLRPSALATAVATACLLGAAPSWAFSSGSTGADGALNPAVNTEIQLPASGILNYSSINIPAGVTVTFKKNAANTPIYLLVSGAATIAGSINISGSDSKHSGTYGDGNLGDDGIPGVGGPGGFDGGRGGRDDQLLTPSVVRGGAGLGPGGGGGATELADATCSAGRYFHYYGLGGAFASAGSNYYYTGYCGVSAALQAADMAAKPYGSNSLQPLIGGSGGGGGKGGTNYAGTGGGGGGGAILIAVSGTFTLASTGAVVSNGGTSGGTNGTGRGYEGAGGSGGAIRVLATLFTGSGALTAKGGCAFSTGTTPSFCGSDNYNTLGGSIGRVRVEADSITYSGTASPAYIADTPSAIFVSSIPTLRIASIAGSNVPANPTGNADVSLPANLTNPVTVNFETTNIPPGSTVELRVVPAYGAVVKALSPAITGSNASGNTSVSVSLPQGPSTLQAITSYTVTVAMGESLSRFAQNERVEKVEIVAGVGKAESTARLITVSGKSFEVPTSILQMVGFSG